MTVVIVVSLVTFLLEGTYVRLNHRRLIVVGIRIIIIIVIIPVRLIVAVAVVIE